MIEVIIATAVLALVTVGALSIMRRGMYYAERSLETTLVRSQIDSQAAMLRYAQMTNSAAWDELRGTIPAATSFTEPTTCPINNTEVPGGSFVLNADASAGTPAADITIVPLDATTYHPASTYALVSDIGGVSPQSYGMWITKTTVTTVSGAIPAYDFRIYGCWYTPGEERAAVLGTIVRLYAN